MLSMKIKQLIPQENYHIKVIWSDNRKADLDCSPYISIGMGKELQNFENFKQAKVDDFGGIYWPNGFDICPDLVEV